MPKGLTKGARDAKRWLEMHPDTPARVLAVTFGLDPSSVYRSAWWKENQQKKAKQEKSA